MDVLDSLVNAMEQVTVEQIDARISEIEQKIKSSTEDLLKCRDALLATRRIVVARTEGAQQRKPRGPRKVRADKGKKRDQAAEESQMPSATGSILERVRTHLNFAGPTRVATLAKALMEDEQSIRSCLMTNPKLFLRDADGAYFLK